MSHTWCGEFTVTPNTHHPPSEWQKMNEQTVLMHSSIIINMRDCMCVSVFMRCQCSKTVTFLIKSNGNPLNAHQHVVIFCNIIIC